MRGSPKGVDPQSVGHAPSREEETMRTDADGCWQMRIMWMDIDDNN